MHPEPYERASVPAGGTDADAGDTAAPAGGPGDEGEPGAGGGGRPPGAFQRGRARFRDWRRSRPFWGGLLLILAGLELVAIPLLSLLVHGAIRVVIYIGIGGVFGIIFGCLLVACGLLSWFHPVQRVFYAIVGTLLALGSFIVTNLGGFFLGMLLGVIGASLVFAWTPLAPEGHGRHREPKPREPSGGLDAVLGEPRADTAGGRDSPAGAGPGASPEPRRTAGGDTAPPPGTGTWSRNAGGGRLLAFPIAPLLVLGGLLAASQPAASAAPPAGLAASATPVASSTAASSPTPVASSTAASSPTPVASSPVASSPSPTASPGPSPPGTPTPAPAASASPSPTRSPKPSTSKRAARPALTAASSPATLTAGTALMQGLSYDGVANVPTGNGGTQQMLKFSMSSLSLSGGIALTVTEGGHAMVTRNSTLSFSGNVVLYATRLSGNLGGSPLTFTPQNPPPLVLPVMTFTHVLTAQPLTTADTLDAAGLTITG